MILIVSEEGDAHASAVATRLAAGGGNPRILDLSRFPARSSLTLDFASIGSTRRAQFTEESGPIDFSDCRVVWWRRPQPFTVPAEVANLECRHFALVEAHSAFSGLWLNLDAFWINHPTRDEEAARKVYQLRVAQEVGLRIPETCVTNNVEDARGFIAARGGAPTVYKAFSGTEQAWRETRLLKPGELELIADVRFAPVIFQEYVPAGVDLRITVVGGTLFPAAIHSAETEYEADFRMAMATARFQAVELPGSVITRLLGLMRRLGLVYGAIDMRRSPDGEYVFLEINPAGQWLFVEQRTGQPIAQALADLMLMNDVRA